jgi:hypothetical protein
MSFYEIEAAFPDSALLKPSMNLDVETFHGTSPQGFGDHQK